ncbi:hypothetical protein LCGC14_1459990 [marine sediment metagenome]|uniref:Uncharacterized protein n=1 Tax=marine sediment metagenome TaxID=412755 RepID=A0A0F9JFY3_9ZZZZ
MFKVITSIPVLTLPAYVALDNVGALLTFPIDANTKSIVLKRLTVIDAAVQDEAYLLHLFTASPSAGARTDADPYVPVAADLALKVASFSILAADYLDSASDSIAIYELDTAIVLTSDDLFGVLECIATPDYVAVDDLTIKLLVEIR